MTRRYTVTVTVDVLDEAPLLAEALADAETNGFEPDCIANAADALRLLIGQQAAPNGCEIVESECAQHL